MNEYLLNLLKLSDYYDSIQNYRAADNVDRRIVIARENLENSFVRLARKNLYLKKKDNRYVAIGDTFGHEDELTALGMMNDGISYYVYTAEQAAKINKILRNENYFDDLKEKKRQEAEILLLNHQKEQAEKEKLEKKEEKKIEKNAPKEQTRKQSRDEQFQRSHAQGIAGTRSPLIGPDSSTGRSYYPYQEAGIDYSLDRVNTKGGVLIGDDMGLGKTIQGIGIINNILNLNRILIVCPAAMKSKWEKELENWLVNKDLSIGIVSGEKGPIPDANIVIINWELLWGLRGILKGKKWDLVIADEAHRINNPNTQAAKSIIGEPGESEKEKGYGVVRALPAARRVLLTGTPMTNNPGDIWAMLHYIDPKRFPSKKDFEEKYLNMDLEFDANGEARYVRKTLVNPEKFNRMLREKYMVRRKLEDIFEELPPPTRQIVPIDVSKDESAQNILKELELLTNNEEFTNALKQSKNRGDAHKVAFTQISKIREDIGKVKAPYVVQRVLDMLALNNDEKIVVFTYHLSVADIIEQSIESIPEYAGTVMVINGKTKEDKYEQTQIFQRDPNLRVLIASPGSIGEGIDLTAANQAIFAELAWSPYRHDQAESRLRRIGQVKPVHVQYITLPNSIDMRMAQLLAEKKENINSVLDRRSSCRFRMIRENSYKFSVN